MSRRLWAVLAVFFLAAPLPLASPLREDSRPLCAVYRFDAPVGPLKGLPPEKAARRLRELGVGAVFGRPADELRRALRAEGIRVFASLGCFQGAEHWKRRPASRPVGSDGRPIEKRGWYAGVCPSQEAVLRDLEKEAARLAGRYDGVWLDFLRYPGFWESPEPSIPEACFCPVCLSRFAAAAGLGYPADRRSSAEKASWILSERREEWERFKVDTIRAAAGRIAKAAKAANPRTLVGLFSVPWEPAERKSVFGQDLGALGPDIDVVSPMAYHAMLGRPASWIAEKVRETRQEAGVAVWPAIAPREGRPGDLAGALEQALAAPSEGAIALSWPLDGNLEALRQACAP